MNSNEAMMANVQKILCILSQDVSIQLARKSEWIIHKSIDFQANY